jgi:hypothetical protein
MGTPKTPLEEKPCKNCSIPYPPKSSTSKFCSDACRREFTLKDGKELGKDYLICQICNRATSNITGIHMKTYHPEWTPNKYRETFPGLPVIAPSALEKITAGSKKAGARMREPEHRKRMSESLKGENNPMHRSNTSDDFRKSISPFSPEFYLKKDPSISLEEATRLANEKKDSVEIVSWTKKEYWMGKGYSEEESIKIVSEKQSTFSKDKCIEKHGEEEGMKVWLARQEKWAKSYKKSNYSKASQKLFSELYPLVAERYKNIYFATLNENKVIEDTGRNHEYRLRLDKKIILPDFYVEDTKRIIEFDGIYWHDYKRRNLPENLKRELERDAEMIKCGYMILRITELEWENDPQKTIQKCLDFLSK